MLFQGERRPDSQTQSLANALTSSPRTGIFLGDLSRVYSGCNYAPVPRREVTTAVILRLLPLYVSLVHILDTSRSE